MRCSFAALTCKSRQALSLSALLCALAGCTTERAAAPRSMVTEGRGRIYGAVAVAEGITLKDADACDGLDVRLTSVYWDSLELGYRQLKPSFGRCLFEFSWVPDNGDSVQLAVAPSPAWRCPNGATPGVHPRSTVLLLQERQTKTRDFRITCPAP